jgi:hypothetical protein
MIKYLIIIATLLLLAASGFSQTPPADLPYDVAPWPKGDSLLMPSFTEIGSLVGVQPEVSVMMRIDKRGNIAEYNVSLGVSDTSRIMRVFKAELFGKVEHAIKSWRFLPAIKKSKPVASWQNLVFTFKYLRWPEFPNLLKDMEQIRRTFEDGKALAGRRWPVSKQRYDLQHFQVPLILGGPQLEPKRDIPGTP